TTWALAGLCVILGLISVDLIHGAIRPPKPVNEVIPSPEEKTPRVGTVAPDFELPDGMGKPRRLRDFKGKQTVLVFFCGCAACRTMARALTTNYARSHKSPQTVAVMSAHWDPSATPAFERDTGAHFTYLHSNDEGK